MKQTGNLKESWNQLLAVVGKPILQVATNIVQKLSSAITKLTEYAKGAINALSKLFNWGGDDTADSISAAASSAENLSSEAESSSESLENVADSSEKAKNSVAGFDKLNVITKSDSGGSDTFASSTSASNGTSVANTVVKAVFRVLLKIYTKRADLKALWIMFKRALIRLIGQLSAKTAK